MKIFTFGSLTLPHPVLHHLPLRDKQRVESVSRRFQWCLIDLLNTKPIPLVFDSEKMELNGYRVSRQQLPGVVEMLGNKAKFSRIQLGHTSRKWLNKILTALVSSGNGCLDKLTAFQVLSRRGVRGGLLTEVLAKCAKLSIVRIDWSSADLNKLTLALKEKTLTQLSVSLRSHSQLQLAQLYRSIKPNANTLKKIRLRLLSMTLDMDLLVSDLYSSAWAALEEIDFQWQMVVLDTTAKLFSSLINLPLLRKCSILLQLQDIQPVNQFLPALVSLFSNQIEIMVAASGWFHLAAGCELVNLIRQLQLVHPDLQVDFGVTGYKLRLALGKVCFEHNVSWARACDAINCAECGLFYPVTISCLWNRATRRVHGVQQNVHLTDRRLDRCRVDSVVRHLNEAINGYICQQWAASHAEMNEAQNQATITFESLVDGIGQFQFAVDCGPCLSMSCPRCANVG